MAPDLLPFVGGFRDAGERLREVWLTRAGMHRLEADDEPDQAELLKRYCGDDWHDALRLPGRQATATASCGPHPLTVPTTRFRIRVVFEVSAPPAPHILAAAIEPRVT